MVEHEESPQQEDAGLSTIHEDRCCCQRRPTVLLLFDLCSRLVRTLGFFQNDQSFSLAEARMSSRLRRVCVCADVYGCSSGTSGLEARRSSKFL